MYWLLMVVKWVNVLLVSKKASNIKLTKKKHQFGMKMSWIKIVVVQIEKKKLTDLPSDLKFKH